MVGTHCEFPDLGYSILAHSRIYRGSMNKHYQILTNEILNILNILNILKKHEIA